MEPENRNDHRPPDLSGTSQDDFERGRDWCRGVVSVVLDVAVWFAGAYLLGMAILYWYPELALKVMVAPFSGFSGESRGY